MELASAEHKKEKKKANDIVEASSDAPDLVQNEMGASVGMPLFLQRAAIGSVKPAPSEPPIEEEGLEEETNRAGLNVSNPIDPQEREADLVAAHALQISQPPRGKQSSGSEFQKVSASSNNNANAIIQRMPLSRVSPMIQRAADDSSSSAAPAASGTGGGAAAPAASEGFIVEDNATDITAKQMRKSDFLSQLRASMSSAVESALTNPQAVELARVQVDQWFSARVGQDSGTLERSIRSDTPEAASASSASDYIPIVSEDVRRTVKRAEEGTAPESSGAAQDSGAAQSPGDQNASAGAGAPDTSGVQRKGRDASPKNSFDSRSIQSQLGPGRSIDSSVSSRMGSAFGQNFSNVRLHTDAKASELSSSLNARAFTIGEHVAFGAGEYQPGTPVGDALIAHELAHVVQQGGGSVAVPMHKGESDNSILEEEADRSAVSAVVSLWSRAKSGLGNIAENAMPRLKSGLRLQRCSCTPTRKPTPPPSEVFNLPNSPAPLSAPGEQILFSSLYGSVSPQDFETRYEITGPAHFNTTGTGPAFVSVTGTGMLNLPMFIDSTWDGVAPITVAMKITRVLGRSEVASKVWIFSKKPYFATTIWQFEGEGEEPLPVGGERQYAYLLGPRADAQGNPRSYLNHTVLERFEGYTCNLRREDLKPEFQAAHPELVTPEQISAFMYNPASFNATFTADASSAFIDRNGENSLHTAWPRLQAALAVPKDVYFQTVQVFETQPGVALGRYAIRRIIKADGRMFMSKSRI